MNKKVTILWTDDEIDLLRPHILLLEERGFDVYTASNGEDAIALIEERDFDLIFLDENMPGMTGLQVLSRLKTLKPNIPVVMITKSEEEDIMDEAIGSKIADYLIKPVNPKQVLLTIKKFIDTKRLVSEKVTENYQSEFGKIGLMFNEQPDWQGWTEIYRKLVFWELELSDSGNSSMGEVFKMQKSEANQEFARYIRTHYAGWFGQAIGDRPLLSPDLFKHRIYPLIQEGDPVIWMVIDNLRFDQWKTIEPLIREYYTVAKEELVFSILPTATQFARNAQFAGLMPFEISKLFPSLWTEDFEEGGKNLHEEELLRQQINRLGADVPFIYDKINNNRSGKRWVENPQQLADVPLAVLVYNFVDMMSHSRTEMQMMRELAEDEEAYRSLTRSWFEHSPLFELLRELSLLKVKVVITTDHGTIQVQNPVKVIGDRQTTTNLRYKQGKNLNYNPREVVIFNPEEIHLPKPNLSTKYIFAYGSDFFAYPNNYHHYVKYYHNTFQHGGVSLEEMIIPLVVLQPKS